MRAIVVLSLLLAACTERHADLGADGGADASTTGLALTPTDPQLVSVDGTTPSVTLEARVIDGGSPSRIVTPDRWDVSDTRVVSGAGSVFTASGLAGGDVVVRAHYHDAVLGNLEASATIHVRVELTIPPDGSVPAGVRERFDMGTETNMPFDAAAIEYPLDGAHMPNNVAPPVVQWYPRGGAGDAYRIVVSSPHVVVTELAYDDGLTFRWSDALDPQGWRIAADSTHGETLAIRVDRIRAGTTAIVRGEPIEIWLSEDGIFGTLYYWQVRVDPQASDVFRLDAASGERESVFSTEPGRCVGCHALDADGRHMAATMDGRSIRWVTSFVDLASSARPRPEIFAPIDPGYRFLAFAPAGDRALASTGATTSAPDSTLVLLDTTNGRPVTATGLPTASAGYPAWSPDGARVAWMEGGGDGPRGTTSPTRIVVADAMGGDAFGSPSTLHDGSTLTSSPEGGVTDSRPTWSPDGRFVAFAHGTSSISAVDAGGEAPRAGLYLASRDGGRAIRLDLGMGPEGPVDAFWPVFSPFATEEADGTQHFWLAFYSRADYGNAREGTAGSDRRQLWVMAIDPAIATTGADPSSPPYWLPGQDTAADDIAALWARTACRPRHETCTSSSECCSGNCIAADPRMPDVLTCEPPSACRATGASCDDASDCCAGICQLGICGYQAPV